MADADVIIIGSGFGGSVTACRLAQAGAKVLVLERGREWSPSNFPREPTDPWVFDANDPLARHGWFDIRILPNMTVATGAGVGGGSLVYANISVEAKPRYVRRRLAGRDHVRHAGAALRRSRPDDGSAARPARAVARADEAPQRRGDEGRLAEPVPAARARGALRPRVDTYDQPDPHNPAKSKIGH